MCKEVPSPPGILDNFSGAGISMPVDILIGSDYYWEFVTGSVCRGISGPVTIHTNWAGCYQAHHMISLSLTIVQ